MMKMKLKIKKWTIYIPLLSVLLLMVLISCSEESKVRKYREKAAPVKKEVAFPGPTATPGHTHFQWDKPDGWNEVPKAQGLRLAAFTIQSQNRESICTIIPLKGEAGGLKANVIRWLGQINVKMEPGSNKLDKLLASGEKFLTKGGFPTVLMDFTSITPNPEDMSILASVITIDGNSVFIKMTGEKSHLIKNKEKFKALCQSFSLKSEM
jgi:hypothetical protein